MPFAHLVGIFPRSEAVVELSRSVERGRAAPEDLADAIARDERHLVALQREVGLDYVTDGQLRWQDLLRPLADHLPGVRPGGIVRWFDNNTFFRHPVVTGSLEPTGRAMLSVIDPAVLGGGPWKAVLPSPYTFAALSEDRSGRGREQLLADAAAVLRAEARALEAAGCAYLQFSDPAMVTVALPGDVRLAREALAVVTDGLSARTALHTFFGDAGPILHELVAFPVDEIGIDLYASTLDGPTPGARGKTVLAGVIDGRNSLLEDTDSIVSHARRLRDRLDADDVAIVPNCDLEFLPWDVAVAKTRRLGEAAAALRG